MGRNGKGSGFWFIILILLVLGIMFTSTQPLMLLNSFVIYFNTTFTDFFSSPSTIIGIFTAIMLFFIFLLVFTSYNSIRR